MRKITAIILFAATMIAFSTPVLANSGPVYWQGYPSSDIISIEENSPIRVENENLLFDFSDSDNSFYAMSGKVTAAYEMFNPTIEPQSVQMAFPFIGNLDNLLTKDISITVDGSVLSYEVYFGDAVDSHRSPWQGNKEANYDFASILKTITAKPYKATNFMDNEKGKLYTIEVQPTTDQGIYFAVDFYFDSKKTKVLTNGFNSYETNGEKRRIGAWCYKSRTLELFVLGENIELNINAYADGKLQKKSDLLTYQISVQEVELKSYLMEYINNNTHVQSGRVIFDNQSYTNQLYNLYAEALDQAFTRNRGYSTEDDLMELGNHRRIITLVYTVEFPQDSGKVVRVGYRTSGTMDRTKTAKPLYTFDYLLNPAGNWSGFKKLNIKIVTPKAAPYVVASSLELVRSEDQVYTTTLAELPEDDFFFTLYEAEKITPLDKVEGYLYNSFGYFTSVVIGGLVLFIIITVIIIVGKLKK
jgi:hypothetical protein